MLEARSLSKKYTTTLAVRDVSFQIRPGEVLGYLGPNGSGKSTTVKMITGLIEPTTGKVLFDGHDIQQDLPAYKKRLGYVPEEAHLYTHLSGLEFLELTGRLRGLGEARLERRAKDLLHLFGLWDNRYSPMAGYSKGMRQKVLISSALLDDPEIVVFDEPLSGLDVNTALVFRHLVRQLAEARKMILYSSHVFEVVEKVCSRVLILRRGEIVAHDSVSRLRDLMSLPSLEDIFAQLTLQEDSEQIARQLAEAIRQ